MASSPRHSPPPSAAAPRPRGILKNAPPGEAPLAAPQFERVDEQGNRLAWDETNLTLHEIERENTAARMKIDEPKTPFVRAGSFGSDGDEVGGFDLDGDASKQGDSSSSGQDAPGARRGSFADQLAANTASNAALGRTVGSSSHAPAARTTSRSPSFSVPPSSRRSSSASNRAEGRGAVRDEMAARDRMDVDGEEAMDDAEDEDDLDPEEQAQRRAFAQKRNQHYGNEAEAMKIAAALASRDEDEEEDEEEEEEADGDAEVIGTPSSARGAAPNGQV